MVISQILDAAVVAEYSPAADLLVHPACATITPRLFSTRDVTEDALNAIVLATGRTTCDRCGKPLADRQER